MAMLTEYSQFNRDFAPCKLTDWNASCQLPIDLHLIHLDECVRPVNLELDSGQLWS